MQTVTPDEAILRINNYLNNTIAHPYFVIVDGSEAYQIVYEKFSYLEKINVSNYCSDNSFPDYDRLFNDLCNSKGKKIVFGLGDSIFLEGRYQILGKIKDVTVQGKIIVICRGIRDKVVALHEADPKFNEYRYCEIDSSLDYNIVKVKPSVYLHNVVKFKDLLRKLEGGIKGKLYVSTDMPVIAGSEIRSSYDAIKEENPAFTIAETTLNEDCWSSFNKDKDLEDYNLLHWRSFLKNKINPGNNGYLRLVVAKSKDYELYQKNVFDTILDIDRKEKNYWGLYKERKELLKDLPEAGTSRYVAMSKQKGEERIYYLTDNTTVERHAIIEEIAKNKKVPKEISMIYPELSMYLSFFHFSSNNSDVLDNYFQKYKELKITNLITTEFMEAVLNYAADGNRLYNSFDSRGALVEKLDDGKTILYWIDALGVEYLGFVQSLAKEMGLHITIHIGRAKLPTLTAFNDDFYKEWKGQKLQTKKLDSLKHDGENIFNYENQKLPLHIVEELGIIDNSLVRSKDILLQGQMKRVVIASDHGASRLAVINNSENQYEMNSKGIHSGRCCPKSEIDEKPEYATEEEGFWVLANYDRFKGGHKARVEVHGGATLEEVLVPVIEVSLANGKYELKNMTEIAWASWNETPFIEIFSPQKIENLLLKYNGQIYQSVDVGNGIHKVVFENLKRAGEYEADVLDGDNLIGKINFRIEKRSGSTRKEEEDFFKK